MDWIWLALIPPFLFALGTHIDKYVLGKYFKGNSGATIIFSCLIGFVVFPLAFLFQPNVFAVSPLTALILILNGFLYIIYLFPYFEALKNEDASTISPLFQSIPMFSALLAFFLLKEVLSLIQLIAFALIIVGAIGINLKIGKKGFFLKRKVLFLMLSAALIIALNGVVFKLFALDLDFWTTVFWQQVGFALFGAILLIFFKKFRVEFFSSLKQNTFAVISLNLFNEIINIIAVLIFAYTTLLAPIALVSVLNGFTPIFVLLQGILLSKMFPKHVKEEISKKIILQKFIFMLLIIAGGILISSTVKPF